MSNLALRFLTAVLLIPLLIAAIRWNSPLGVWFWVLFAQLAGAREWMKMMMPHEPELDRGFGMLIGTSCALSLFWVKGDHILLVFCGITLLSFLFFLFRYGNVETVSVRIAHVLTGVLYSVVLISPLALFKKRPEGDGGAWVYICLTVSWLSDTGAYFAGRFLGPSWPRKLYAAISPKKTLVGAFGGLLGSTFAVALAKFFYLPKLTTVDIFLIAIPANVLGQLGDLCESLIKRSAGVKDSGALLPGHGGMLDRIDALMFVVPYVYAYATLVHSGHG